MSPTPLTAPAVHILQPHSCHQQAEQSHGDELHRRLSGSGLPGVVSMNLVKLRALPWSILQCPGLIYLKKAWEGFSRSWCRGGEVTRRDGLFKSNDHMENASPHLSAGCAGVGKLPQAQEKIRFLKKMSRSCPSEKCRKVSERKWPVCGFSDPTSFHLGM